MTGVNAKTWEVSAPTVLITGSTEAVVMAVAVAVNV